MRTKTLLLAAVTLTLGIACSQAQVYSQNVVGYINQVIPVGFSMAANQLDSGTNTIATLLPSPNQGTHVYKFVGPGYATANYHNPGGWNDATMTLNPGEGVFIYNPGPNPMTNAFVGTVLQGNFTNSVPAGFTLQSYVVPISGPISTVLGYPVASGDIFTYGIIPIRNMIYIIITVVHGVFFGEPTVNVGQSLIYSCHDRNQLGLSLQCAIRFSVNQKLYQNIKT